MKVTVVGSPEVATYPLDICPRVVYLDLEEG